MDKNSFYRAPSAIIDTHCHLDYLIKERPLEEILQECASQQVEKVITIAVSSANLDFVQETTLAYPNVYGSLGIHPHEAQNTELNIIDKIRDLVGKNRSIVAIGEIGLDFYYNKATPERQHALFEKCLELAGELHLPVIIHSRDADQDMISFLKRFAPHLPKKGVIHSFTSGAELAETALDLGFYLGFNGIISFKNAENVRDILRLTPLDRILAETDAPFLTPVPFRGRTNFPYLVPFVAKIIAEIKEVDEEMLLQQLMVNCNALFFSQLTTKN